MLCAGGGSRKSDGVTPSLSLNMHLNPPASHGPPSSAASPRPTSRPSSGRSTTSRSSTAHAAAAGGGTDSAAVSNVQLRPSTVWLSLPLLQRLQSFFEPLANLPAAATQDDRCGIPRCICQTLQCPTLIRPVTAHAPGSFVRAQMLPHLFMLLEHAAYMFPMLSACRVGLVRHNIMFMFVLYV